MLHADVCRSRVLVLVDKLGLSAAPLMLLPLALACSGEGTDAGLGPLEEPVGAQSEQVLGSVSTSGCTTDETNHIRRAFIAGRLAARSRGFAQCVDTAMREGIELMVPDALSRAVFGPYKDCASRDSPAPMPPPSTYRPPGIDERIRQVLFAATSTNRLVVQCGTEERRANADYRDPTSSSRNGIPYIADPETVRLHMLWRREIPKKDDKVEADPSTSNWNFFQPPRANTAAVLWHEAMHQWGYYHHEVDVVSCPDQGDLRSVNKIVQGCMEYVMLMSRGDPTTSGSPENDYCSGGMRRVYTPYAAETDHFQCTVDPTFEVGVIPDVGVACPGEELTISMDDEDNDNLNKKSGWIGATESGANTRFRFCRVPGHGFFPPSSNTNQANYGVLRMGEKCPNGSVATSVYWDNEDSSNRNSSTGHVAPSTLTSNTRLELCVFEAFPTSAFSFPTSRMPSHYGVFGTSELPGKLESGFIRADGEHNNNDNELPSNVVAPFLYTKSNYIQVMMAQVH